MNENLIKNKKGGIYIEAALVMPSACLIAVLLISLSVCFYEKICVQVEEHKIKLDEIMEGYEASYLRAADKIHESFKD